MELRARPTQSDAGGVVGVWTHLADTPLEYARNVRALVEAALPRDSQLFNEFHALVVNTAKNWCRKREPRCAECPLGSLLPEDSPLFQIRVTKTDTSLGEGMPS